MALSCFGCDADAGFILGGEGAAPPLSCKILYVLSTVRRNIPYEVLKHSAKSRIPRGEVGRWGGRSFVSQRHGGTGKDSL